MECNFFHVPLRACPGPDLVSEPDPRKIEKEGVYTSTPADLPDPPFRFFEGLVPRLVQTLPLAPPTGRGNKEKYGWLTRLVRDTESDPRWGWLGLACETTRFSGRW